MRTLILLLISCISAFGAQRGVSFDSNTLVVSQTNLTQTFEIVNATDSINAGVPGQTGVLTIGGSVSTNNAIVTMTSSNLFIIVNTEDIIERAAFNLVVTNAITQANILHLYNGTTPVVYINSIGGIFAPVFFAEDTPGSDIYTRMSGTEIDINSGLNNSILLDVAAGTITMVHESTNTFFVAQDSGYLGGGTLVLTDDGTYKDISSVGAGGGNVLNTGASLAGQVPAYTDITGTNVAPSAALLLNDTNAAVVGTLTADGVISTNWVYVATSTPVTTAGSTNTFTFKDLTDPSNTLPGEIGVACSDETTALTTGTAKVTFRMPYAATLTGVRASLSTAQTSGNIFTVDINEAGVSVLSTKITIDNGEKTSTTAATPPVISDSALADDAEITVDIDQIGDGTAKGLKLWLLLSY